MTALLHNFQASGRCPSRPATANFAATDPDSPIRIAKRKLKKIHHRPNLIDGRLAATGLAIETW